MRVLFLLFLPAVLALTGCAGPGGVTRYGAPCPRGLDNQLRALDIKAVFNEMARDLCPKTKCDPNRSPLVVTDQCDATSTVIVTDFVELDSFEPSSAGLLMAESMRSSLNGVCGYRIRQAEFARIFSLTTDGLSVLTRDADLVRDDEVRRGDVIVGTYSESKNKLMLFAKRFNMYNGKITKMTSREITYTCSDFGAGFTYH